MIQWAFNDYTQFYIVLRGTCSISLKLIFLVNKAYLNNEERIFIPKKKTSIDL